MHYVIVYYAYVAHILFNVKISANTLPSTAEGINIDSFISQLLASEKFDELAEIIAEKAADKIKNVKALRTDHLKYVGVRSQTHSESEERPYYDHNQPNNIHAKGDEENEKHDEPDTHADILDKMNAQPETLGLKYKNLKRKVFIPVYVSTDRSVLKNYTNMAKTESLNTEPASTLNLSSTQGIKTNKNVTEKNEHIPIEIKPVIDVIHKLNKNASIVDRNKNSTTYENQLLAKETVQPFKKILDKNETKGQMVNNPTTNKFAADIETPDVEENKVTSDKNPNESESRDDSNQNGEHSGQYTEDEKTEEKSESSTRKPVIRQEGEKLFTFVENSDYDEYHEQVAKMKKEDPENPLDFIS